MLVSGHWQKPIRRYQNVLLFGFWIRSMAKRAHMARHVDNPLMQFHKSLDNVDKGGSDDNWAQQKLRDWSICPSRGAWGVALLLSGEGKALRAPQSSLCHLWAGVNRTRIFKAVHVSRTRDNRLKLKQEKFTLGIRKTFFLVRTSQ